MSLETTADFAEALTDLRIRAGLTIRDLSRRTGIPSATLGGYFSGRHLPPATNPQVLLTLLEALGVPDAQHERWLDDLRSVRRTSGSRRRRETPYRGLESFDVSDSDWYFGRESLAAEIRETLTGLAAADRSRFVLVVGASGSGKSSLLRAGVAARLDTLAHAICVPGAQPVEALAAAEHALGDGRGLLIVDQFEEIFHPRVSGDDQVAFLNRLIALSDDSDKVGIVVAVALRADFYGHAVAEPTLLPLLQRNQVLVGPMAEADLRQAIVEPALRAGRAVEPELVDLLLRDLAQQGRSTVDATALPLLSHALLATWNRADGNQLTVADYVAVGGLAGAVQRTAEDVYSGLTQHQQRTARRLFGQLVSVVDDDLVATRRRAGLTDLVDDEDIDAVVEAFVAGRILTATATTLEISHEVLLEAWPRLRGWLTEDQEDLRIRKRVSSAAADWDTHGRTPDGLMRGILLTVAQRLNRPDGSVRLAGRDREFFEASVAEDGRRQARERRRHRRLVNLLVTVAVLALVGAVLSTYLFRAVGDAREQRNHADRARAEALSRQVAIQAERLVEQDPSLSAQLALAAFRIAPTKEARSALLDTSVRRTMTRVLGPEGAMRVVASPVGGHFAIVGSDGEVRFFEAGKGGPPHQVASLPGGAGGELYAAAYSPDGALFAAGGAEGGLTLFDVSDPFHPVPAGEQPTGPELAVYSLAFSADGATLYAATGDPGLYRWTIDGGVTALQVEKGFDNYVQGVAVRADGLVASASADGKVRLWSEQGSHRPLRAVAELAAGSETNFVYSVAFSPDGDVLAATAKDQRVRLWDVSGATPRVLPSLTGFTSWVNDVAFSPDGTTMAAVASGGLAKIWQTDDWSLVTDLSGPTNFTTVSYAPDGKTLLTGSVDGIARLFATDSPMHAGLGDSIWGIGYPSAGDRLYVGVGSQAPATLAYDASSPRVLGPIELGLGAPAAAGVTDGVVSVSPDGRLLVSGTATGRLVLWRRGDGDAWRNAGVLNAATQLIENVAFSPDGRRLASTADDGAVAVYDVSGPGRPREVEVLDAEGIAIGLAFNEDASLLAVTTTNRDVQLYRATEEGYEQVDRVDPFENYAYSAAFSPDGKWLAAGSADKTIRLFQVSPDGLQETGEPLRGPQATLVTMSFTPDGDLLAAASQDGALWLWSFADGGTAPWATLRGLGVDMLQVLFHPVRDELAGAGAEGRVGVWQIDVDAVAAHICSSAGSGITDEEWELYVPGAAYDPPCG